MLTYVTFKNAWAGDGVGVWGGGGSEAAMGLAKGRLDGPALRHAELDPLLIIYRGANEIFFPALIKKVVISCTQSTDLSLV